MDAERLVELTLADCIGERGTAKRLPDAPGYWICRDEDRDEIWIIDRDEDGNLCNFYFPRRPLVVYLDGGEWYGPFRLELVEGESCQ